MTNSLPFPNMFDIAHNRVSVIHETASVANRSALLIQTEPTELYNSPNFGVGLKRHLWQYNNDNEIAIINDRIVEQLRLHEPCFDANKSVYFNNKSKESMNDLSEVDKLDMSFIIPTIYDTQAEVKIDEQ